MPSYILVCTNEHCNFSTEKTDIEFCPNCRSVLLKISKEDEKRWVGIVLKNQYQITKVIGKGGMGIVCVAEQMLIGRPVAVKLLRREFIEDQEAAKRFLREARAAGGLSHPNIVTIHEVGQTEDGVLFLVMEFVRGETLSDLIKKKKRLTYQETCAIISQICDGLTHAHANGIIHRDLKPDNIVLIKQEDDGYFVKILDFGIAKIVGRGTKTRVGLVMGTPEYISPEQARGLEADLRADLYSLGCLIYECLTGRPPFLGDDPLAVLLKQTNEEARPVSEANPDLSNPMFDRFFRKALSKNREDRFANARELKTAFLAIKDPSMPEYTPELLLPVERSNTAFDLRTPLQRGMLWFNPKKIVDGFRKLSGWQMGVIGGLVLLMVAVWGLYLVDSLDDKKEVVHTASVIKTPEVTFDSSSRDAKDAKQQIDIKKVEQVEKKPETLRILRMREDEIVSDRRGYEIQVTGKRELKKKKKKGTNIFNIRTY